MLHCPRQDTIELSSGASHMFTDGSSMEDSDLPVPGLDSSATLKPHNEYQHITGSFTETMNQFRSHSLPMYFSKRCKACNKPQLYAKTHLPHFTWNDSNVTESCVTCQCLIQRSTVSDDRSYLHPPSNTHYAKETSHKHIETVSHENDGSRHGYLKDKVDPLSFKRKRQVWKKMRPVYILKSMYSE